MIFKIHKFKFLISGGLDSAEPWQGRWSGGVLVECVGSPNNIGSSNRDRTARPSANGAGQIKH